MNKNKQTQIKIPGGESCPPPKPKPRPK
jgi:hypothetical protein